MVVRPSQCWTRTPSPECVAATGANGINPGRKPVPDLAAAGPNRGAHTELWPGDRPNILAGD
jgi:hypothetical protein